MGELVTVIIPIYKVEKYLDKCVESATRQSYRDLEIILVDDQSPDGCPEICDSWAQRDNRIRVIHKTNEGVGIARNTGLAAASGKYIMFVDSDDYLPTDAVQVLLERLIANGSDMAIGKNLMVFPDGHTNGSACDFMKDQVMTGEDFLTSMGGKNLYSVAPWGKLYTRAALEGITFPTLICGQDMWVFPLIVLQCGTVSVVDHLVYYYYQRPSSTMQSGRDPQKLSALKASQHMTEIFLKRGQLDCAARWLGIGIESIQKLERKQTGVNLVHSLFRPEETTAILRRCAPTIRAKWWLLHHPALYNGFFGAKQWLTALLRKK